MSTDFNKEFVLYTFSTNSSCVAILTQKNLDGIEVSISFMSSGFQGDEIKYPEVVIGICCLQGNKAFNTLSTQISY